MELDRWSEERDKVLASPASASHVPFRYGLADLDAAGQWIETDIGPVWKPKIGEGWAPFQKGRWRWYDTLGYTWVSDEDLGLAALSLRPLDAQERSRLGVGAAGVGYACSSRATSTGSTAGSLAGWGPLAPGEEWSPAVAPQQFLNVNTTYATFVPDAA